MISTSLDRRLGQHLARRGEQRRLQVLHLAAAGEAAVEAAGIGVAEHHLEEAVAQPRLQPLDRGAASVSVSTDSETTTIATTFSPEKTGTTKGFSIGT